MGLDYTDTVLVREIRDAVKDGNKANAAAFNRVAAALEALAKEVKGLREDLKPQDLDKPARLPQPDSKGATP